MLFKFKTQIANCNEWEVREEVHDEIEMDCLYLRFSGYTRDYDLKRGSKEKIYKGILKGFVDLADCEI